MQIAHVLFRLAGDVKEQTEAINDLLGESDPDDSSSDHIDENDDALDNVIG